MQYHRTFLIEPVYPPEEVVREEIAWLAEFGELTPPTVEIETRPHSMRVTITGEVPDDYKGRMKSLTPGYSPMDEIGLGCIHRWYHDHYTGTIGPTVSIDMPVGTVKFSVIYPGHPPGFVREGESG